MGSQRIQMNVTDQLPKIDLFIADDGMITVLKQMPMPMMAKIVGHSVAGQEPSHQFRKTRRATAYEEMGMIGQ
jgi:hypothetical protein